MEIKKYICPYCGKEFDNPYKLGGHKVKCKFNPKCVETIEKWKQSFIKSTHENKNGFNNLNREQNLYCQHCGKECKSLNSLINHERLCKENSNRQESPFVNFNKNRIEYSNQFIKAKQEGYEIIVSEETRKKISLNWLGKHHKTETKELIQKTIDDKIKNNKWHNNFGIKIKYKNDYFDSSWEIEFVKYLDSKNIKWKRPKNAFNYYWNNSNHKYYPDIYLPEYNLYIEIKGIPSERDYAKWSQFPENLDIYDSEDLYNLGLSINIDKRNLVNENFKRKHLKLGEEA